MSAALLTSRDPEREAPTRPATEPRATRAARLERRCANYPRCRTTVPDTRHELCAACAGWLDDATGAVTP